jgi:tripeptide aminopeptidase
MARSAGNLEDETFSADKATITIRGVSAHPGFAKGKMENAIKIAARIVERLPKETCSPEATEGREGFSIRPMFRRPSKVRR